MTPADTFHMTQSQQDRTLVIAIVVCIAIVIGFKSLWEDWREQWDKDDTEAEIDALTNDLMIGRNQHYSDDRDALLRRRAS